MRNEKLASLALFALLAQFAHAADESIIVKKGWNLISSPINGKMIDAAYLKAQGAQDIFAYENDAQTYKTPDYIEPGRGYWLYAAADANITITPQAMQPAQTVTIDSVVLKAMPSKWTLLGVPFSATHENIKLQNSSGQPIVYGYDASGGSYSNGGTIGAGCGFWYLLKLSDTQSSGAQLTDAQKESLQFMWQEEKMARDVYNAMFTKWGAKQFSNISKAETTHMDSIKTLMVKYGLTVEEDIAGKFSNAQIQALYDSLIAQGNISLTDAYKVGKTVEETDINDLNIRMQTATAEMNVIYATLRSGSYNHLEAFNKALAR